MSTSKTASSRARKTRAEATSAAIAALKLGHVIVFPTETLYGLGADALNSAAVERVFQLKGRDPTNPIPVLIADRAMLLNLVSEVPPLAEKLIARFWPGPLTIVFPARRDIPRPLVNPAGGIGVRISSQPIANELVQALGHPITATSANPSGQPPARNIEQAKNYFDAAIKIFVGGGELTSKTGSTVAEVIGNRIRIIREGEIDRDELQRAVGKGKVIA
ncbi:MAG: L-threonylcarbamoyladenylate synthase [Candidatus Binatia bacterium]